MALKCEEVRDRFSALWEKELILSEEAEVRRHLGDCPDCREEFGRFDKTLRWLHSVEETEAPEGFLSGIYEKLEKRKEKGLSPERTPREGHGLKWKVPLQAAAMVAIVFLALYLTKMMPDESPRMKGAKESKPSSDERRGDERKEPAEIKTPITKEDKSDRRLAYKESKEVEKEKVSGRLNEKPEAERPEKGLEVTATEASRSGRSEPQPAPAPPPEKKRSDEALESKSTENRVEEREGGKGSGAPQAALTGTIKKEKPLMAKRAASPEPVPFQEFIVKSSDREKSLSELHELVERFGGETLRAEKNSLLVSLPRSSLSEFRRELEGIVAPAKAQQAVSPKAGTEGAVENERAKRKDAQEKVSKIKRLDAAKETMTIIRIVLSEE